MDLSLVIPVINEKDNIAYLIPALKKIAGELGITHEILVINGGSSDGTAEAARDLGARVLSQRAPGYGEALKEGFRSAGGGHILTLDADLAHRPDFIKKLWECRGKAELVIASRFVPGAIAHMSLFRKILSRALNLFYSVGLSLPIKDLSSGFRLYRADVVKGLRLESRHFEIQEEILVKIYTQGFKIEEVPFVYYPRKSGSSHARVFAFGICLLMAFFRMRRLRKQG